LFGGWEKAGWKMEKEGSDSKQWNILYVHGWENKALSSSQTTKKNKKKSFFLEILAWSTVNNIYLSTLHFRKKNVLKTAHPHQTHLKKQYFSPVSTENKRIKENPKTPDEFSGNEDKSPKISQLCSLQVTKENTPVEQIPNKMIKREKPRSRIKWEAKKRWWKQWITPSPFLSPERINWVAVALCIHKYVLAVNE